MSQQGVKISSLKTIKNFANQEGVTAAYIYKLISKGDMEPFIIDGVQFINTDKFPGIPAHIKRR